MAIEETPGHVNVWIYNGRGDTSTALLAEVNHKMEGYWEEATGQWIAGYRPAGMRMDVHAMVEQSIPVEMELDVAPGYRTDALMTQARAALKAAILAEDAQGLLRLAQLINSVLLLPRIDGARLLSPTQSVPVAINSVLVPGTITVTWNPEAG